VVLLVAELRGHEHHAAELEQWKTHHEVRKVIDASPAAITLALLLTGEELDSLEKRAGDGEIAGRGRPGGSDVASPQPAARHGETAHVFPANASTPDRATGPPRHVAPSIRHLVWRGSVFRKQLLSEAERLQLAVGLHYLGRDDLGGGPSAPAVDPYALQVTEHDGNHLLGG
jgi:hypothetical protein